MEERAAETGSRASVMECGGPPPLFPERLHRQDGLQTISGILTKRQTTGALHDAGA
jgi:hypothetical protein